jgi:UPF0755 protein
MKSKKSVREILKKKRNGVYRLFTLIFAIIFLLFFITPISNLPAKPTEIKNDLKEIFIPKNTSYAKAIHLLKQEGLVRYELPYRVLATLTGADKKLKAGYYEFATDDKFWTIFDSLQNGKIRLIRITVIEGDTLNEICEKLTIFDIFPNDCLRSAMNRDLLASYHIKSKSLEGYLYPETYFFAKGVSQLEIFDVMIKELKKRFSEKMLERSKELNMNMNQVLTLASMIEKEAVIDSERPLISAVFHNRLKENMPLQSDPTAIYGKMQNNGVVTAQDVRQCSEYNTYFIKGLPPGPISSVNVKSIQAALYPADVDFLYFVAKKDGSHFFSKTYDEHLSAIQQYLKHGANHDERKLP